MKTIRVAAAIIVQDGRIFATQRGYGAFRDFWEFPGGKIEAGESPRDTIRREIREELAAEVTPVRHFATVEYDYPDFHLSMECYISRLDSGKLTLLEHEAAKWLSQDELGTVNWLPADLSLIQDLKTAPLDI
ncbi:(deoxy)nucleoside triphosphate pyrophosphohydrolase [Succinimonas amylolytica]|uniref:(deoxy)nucleoside triphosphate pyrophosphohydrolase n=1 Tax=Succinimonas amylolytica TaxID=83769 RepID=UPI00036C9C4A|nr:(deoxy)nucleoside triphosphate pyrophosphohydrolase [Succinimonas amylolytica]